MLNGEARHSPESVRGDGTVPAASALVEGVPAYRVDFEHSDLMRDPKVLEAVPCLLRGQRLPLESVTPNALAAPMPEGPPASLDALTAKWELEAAGVRERMRAGIGRAEDTRWVFRTN